MRVSCVWYASSALLSGKLNVLIDLSCVFCDWNGDVALSTPCFVFGVSMSESCVFCDWNGDVAQSIPCFVFGVLLGDI